MDNLGIVNFEKKLSLVHMDGLKKWMQESANILFDDSKNDLRSLPKAVRLQILLVLSFIWKIGRASCRERV